MEQKTRATVAKSHYNAPRRKITLQRLQNRAVTVAETRHTTHAENAPLSLPLIMKLTAYIAYFADNAQYPPINCHIRVYRTIQKAKTYFDINDAINHPSNRAMHCRGGTF
jgi:hypothetical protein